MQRENKWLDDCWQVRIKVSFIFLQVKEFAKGASTGGKSKGASSGKPPPFFEVCEQIKPLVDHGEPIPPLLMAKLLKFKLLHIKQKDLERREEERKVCGSKKKYIPYDKPIHVSQILLSKIWN